MTFQNITFKHTNSHTDSSIRGFVTQKLNTLLKYVNEEQEVTAEVEFEKVAPHKSGPICRVEVNVTVGGTLYRAESIAVTFEAAVDVVRDQLDQEMRKAHKKRNSLFRKGGRTLKEMMQLSK